MCDRKQAAEIMSEAYRYCADFMPIEDGYLYGSYARGDYDKESDVDILFTAELTGEEIASLRREIAHICGQLSLKHDVTVSVSVKPKSQFDKYSSVLPYYKNVIKEGIRYAGQ